jgi:tetratricopeptide (TPR) repeat protein
MKKATLSGLLLVSFCLLLLNFKTSFFFTIDSHKAQVWDLNPNVGIPMCGASGNAYIFDVLKDGTVPVAPKLEGLGNLHFEITTVSSESQAFFNQGIRLVYAFNHAEALRAFQEATRLDPDCAMAYWGQALCVGPNINDPFPDLERQKVAYKAIEKAKMEISGVTSVEKDLIHALASRCTPTETDQQELNIAYHIEMQRIYANHKDHPEVATLFAASIMNTMPWDYYNEYNQPKKHTLDCIDALKGVIERYPDHPGAHHYFIHIIEAFNPDEAIPSANTLGDLMPGAGHLVHMPSHIYIGVGMYQKAAEHNRRAIKADEEYIAQCQAQGMYPLAYYTHNIHFLWAATSMMGNSREAIAAAKKVADKTPYNQAEEIHFMQDFLSVPIQAYTRFGKWNEILTTPPPGENLLHTTMMWHYARGMALTRLGMIDKAEWELQEVKRIKSDPKSETILAAYTNPTSKVGMVASEALAGEIEAAKGNTDKAIEHLSAAVKHESNLAYQEPAAWHAPTRHYLGALLLEAGKHAEAEKVYREDLKHNRDNGWALFGLHQSLIAQGKVKESEEIKKQFENAWQYADVALTSSRY